MYVYKNATSAKSQNFLVQIPANQLIGKLKFNLPVAVAEKFSRSGLFTRRTIAEILNKSLVTITLVDNFRSVQEVLATKLPLSLFNDISSLGEGAVVHSLYYAQDKFSSALDKGVAASESDPVKLPVQSEYAYSGDMQIMFKIPIAFTGSLDLDSNKYLRVDLELSHDDKLTLNGVEVYARQTSSFTNDAIRYKRLNVPDGVLTYEFVPEGCAYIVNGQANGVNTANVDFVELTYNTGLTSHVDFYELLAKYYEENEISSRLISASENEDLQGEMLFESTILTLDTIGVTNIRIVRNNTDDDTTIVVMDKLVTSASENNSSAGEVVKLASGQYVAANEKVVATEELKQLMTPQKPYAAAITINKMAAEAVVAKPSVVAKPAAVGIQPISGQMPTNSLVGLVSKMK